MAMVRALGNAHRWAAMLTSGFALKDIADREEFSERWCQTNSNWSHEGQDGCPLFGTETAPLGEGGGAVSLEIRSGSEVAL